ncbi:uncharacterized protein LOC134846753 [Symsagittifera roscoffensis]|uniref:uncharacterized protein LOC134846753 n=1 Tax=Symsagittifera roscoffensis TaxID=84072 RepID=UPI00307BBA35
MEEKERYRVQLDSGFEVFQMLNQYSQTDIGLLAKEQEAMPGHVALVVVNVPLRTSPAFVMGLYQCHPLIMHYLSSYLVERKEPTFLQPALLDPKKVGSFRVVVLLCFM